MDIYDYLKMDHEMVSKLFKQFEEAVSFLQKREIFERIYYELNLHAESEQEIFYKVLEDFPGTQNLIKHSEHEHIKIMDILNEISQPECRTTIEWSDKIIQLKKLVAHHVREEENTVFSEAKKVLSEKKAVILKEKMHDYKEQMLAAAL